MPDLPGNPDMSSRQNSQPWVVYLAAIATLLVGAVALSGAVGWHGRSFPGVLVDPDRAVSSIGLPSWEGMVRGLRFPDRVVAVDGTPLRPTKGELSARQWDREVSAAVAEGKTSIRVSVEGPSGPKEVTLALLPFDEAAWWLFGGGLHLIGIFYVGGALIAVRARPQGKLARTFARFSLLVALFLFTLLDYHTDRRLVSFFLLAFAMAPMAALSLPLRLPTDARLIQRFPWIESALNLSGLALGVVMVVMTAAGQSTLRIRSAPSMLFGFSMLFLAIGLLARMWRSSGDDREVMKKLLLATVPIAAAIGLAFLLAIFELTATAMMWC